MKALGNFWALKSKAGWLQHAERVLWEDNKPGNGIVMFPSRRKAIKHRDHFSYPEFQPTKVSLSVGWHESE